MMNELDIMYGTRSHASIGMYCSCELLVTKIAPYIWPTKEIHVTGHNYNPLGKSDLEVALYFHDNDRLALHQLWRKLDVGELYLAEGQFAIWETSPHITIYGPTLVRLRDSKVLWKAV